MTLTKRDHAVVIGASMAGLLAARVASDFYKRVTVLERDISHDVEPRKGVPQGHHSHVLLTKGHSILNSLFPSFTQDCINQGAIIRDVRDRYDFYYRGYWPHMKTDMTFTGISRPALEYLVRGYVAKIANITMQYGYEVQGFSYDKNDILGVKVSNRMDGSAFMLAADLVIDAQGRGSRTPQWLTDNGFLAPSESHVHVNIKYATRIYSRGVCDENARTHLVVHDAPHTTKAGCAIPIEQNRYIITLADMFGKPVPASHDDFLRFAKTLAAPDIFNLISKESPQGETHHYNFPYSRWRHYEKMSFHPRGLVVVGDAVSSFNPIYGQGMTVAALDAQTLGEWLKNDKHNHKALAQDIAANVQHAWDISVGADFAFPNTIGPKAFGVDFVNWYFKRFTKLAPYNPELTRLFFEVTHLLKKPHALFQPRIIAQVLLGRQRNKNNPAPVLSDLT